VRCVRRVGRWFEPGDGPRPAGWVGLVVAEVGELAECGAGAGSGHRRRLRVALPDRGYFKLLLLGCIPTSGGRGGLTNHSVGDDPRPRRGIGPPDVAVHHADAAGRGQAVALTRTSLLRKQAERRGAAGFDRTRSTWIGLRAGLPGESRPVCGSGDGGGVAPELEEVVGGGEQLPFGLDGGEPAATEPADSTSVFDLPEDRLDGRTPHPRHPLAAFGA